MSLLCSFWSLLLQALSFVQKVLKSNKLAIAIQSYTGIHWELFTEQTE